MRNEDMRPNRFLRWHQARQKAAAIKRHLEAGHTVVVSTYLKATKYDKRHVDLIKAVKTGVYARHGKYWVCIDGAAIRVYG